MVNVINYKAYLFKKTAGVEPNMVLIDYEKYKELFCKFPNVIHLERSKEKADILHICNIPATLVSGDTLEVGYFSTVREVSNI